MEYNFALVLGGGKFGTLAFKALVRRCRRVVVVDKDPNCLASKALRMVCSDPSKCEIGARLVLGDAAAYAAEIMRRGKIPEIIIPAIPGNSMAMLFARWLSEMGFSVAPDPELFERASVEVPKDVVLLEDKKFGTMVLSNAKGFTCNPRCDGPEICPVTGEKITPIYPILTNIGFCDHRSIFGSTLIDRGVGAVDGNEVYSEIMRLPRDRENYTLCVGTACNCHGIVTFMRCSKQQG
ncbi:MAG: hypothetical protein DSO08_02475 [Candidatus Methanomethylicota archaeon]|uniref:RCK N-terminal domain-containing protein n=1 Tax=Thermoproteota archaeon TaxID=2056631 RepID=A0A523BFM7_9CREN|nr:MAG: hypothetical protein DSO08_02475 [Candidatus Verstraetearchaeota archaeon]